MAKISNATIEAIYPVVRDVYKKLIPRADGVRILRQDFNINKSSAADFMVNFGMMLKGKKYTRKNTIFGTDLYLKMIREDFGTAAFENALLAVRKHLAYYESVPTGSRQPGHALVLAKYELLSTSRGAESTRTVEAQGELLDTAGEFDPDNEVDNRRWMVANIARRQGQPEFRRKLLEAYGNRCAISGSRVGAVLEAAHILGYKGELSNFTANGLLLRSDLHTLFDLFLIAVDPKSMTVLVSPSLRGSVYEKFAGKTLKLPKEKYAYPSVKALEKHRVQSGLS